jgi:hypothetical protein
MRAIPGRIFIFAFALVIALVAVIGFRTLRQAQDRRFAVSLRAQPEGAAPDEIPLSSQIVVRIEKRTAGRSEQTAWALLLDGGGRLLAEPQPLVARTLDNGKRVEETTFPPLGKVPAQRIVAAVVLRTPPEKEAAVRTAITQILSAVEQRNGQLREAFGNLLPTVRRLGGHAELVQGQVPKTAQ